MRTIEQYLRYSRRNVRFGPDNPLSRGRLSGIPPEGFFFLPPPPRLVLELERELPPEGSRSRGGRGESGGPLFLVLYAVILLVREILDPQSETEGVRTPRRERR